jgi:hypothetical protein
MTIHLITRYHNITNKRTEETTSVEDVYSVRSYLYIIRLVFQHLSRVFYHRIIVLQAQPGMQKLFYPKDIINKIEINKKLKQLAKEKDNISSEGNRT